MNHLSTTAREALIAEVIGDVARLLDRVDALAPVILEAERSLLAATERLDDQIHSFETRMTTIIENAKVQAVNHIVRRTAEVAGRAADAQRRAMEEAASALFKAQVESSLQRLVASLRHLLERADRPWDCWMTHAATAVVASATTLVVATWLRAT
jgi:hypothetical protein